MNALEIKDLSKSFGSFSLQNLTLTVPMGTALGLIGENGAGKSTTISLILGQLRRDSGPHSRARHRRRQRLRPRGHRRSIRRELLPGRAERPAGGQS